MKLSRLILVAALATLFTTLACGAKICVDPGHGGTDNGANNYCYGGSNVEDANTLATSIKFRDWMNRDTSDGAGGGSWNVVMCRTTDVFVSLQGRCDIANNNACERFMCIHNNAANCGACGTETFCYGTGTYDVDIRNRVQSRMIAAWNRVNRGNKTADFYVLVYTNMAAELCELAFIDSSIDNPFVSGSTNQDNAALNHLYAIQGHYGIGMYKPGTGSGGAKDYINDNPACSANWATGTSATDKYGTSYRYRSTAAVSDPASWGISVPSSGNYDVSAWWPAGANRSATASYTVPDTTKIVANQRTNGGRWNVLKTVNMASGTRTTTLSCWTTTGFVVMADAVKYYGPK